MNYRFCFLVAGICIIIDFVQPILVSIFVCDTVRVINVVSVSAAMQSKMSNCKPRPSALRLGGLTGPLVDYPFPDPNSLEIGVAVIDRSLRFKSVNRSLAEMNGLPQEAHLGKPLHKVVGTLIGQIGPSIEHVIRTGQPSPSIEISGQLPARPDANRWMEYYFPLRYSHGKVVETGALVFELGSLCGAAELIQGPTTWEGYRKKGRTLPPGALQRSKLLSGREKQVLALLAAGKSTREVSAILAISLKTVETYRYRTMLKVQAKSLAHLVHYAIRHQIVSLQ